MENTKILTEKIVSYIAGRAKEKLEKFDKEAEKERKKYKNSIEQLEKVNEKLEKQRLEEEIKYKPSIWLSDASKRAWQISFATHVLKFTHTDAKGSNINVKKKMNQSNIEPVVLTTFALKDPPIDVAGNAAALDVASLLQLEANGIKLIDLIAQGDASALAPFAESDGQLTELVNGFKEAIADKELSSHKLAKQLYFPVSHNNYHLISPLYSSTLSHVIYKRISEKRYSELSKAARKAKREEKYFEDLVVEYPNTAVQKFGGTKPQIVSLINNNRRGKSFLLSCQPPVWKRLQQPPSQHKNAFWSEYNRRAKPTVKELEAFLVRTYQQTKTKYHRDRRANLVDDLINMLIDYAVEVQSLTSFSGWSAESKLSLAEQLWLDPYRNDSEFQTLRKSIDWRKEIADQFASWLNRNLKGDKLFPSDVEHQEWSKLVRVKLASFKDELEILEG